MLSKTVIVLTLGISLGLVQGYEDKTIAKWLTDNGYTQLVNLLIQGGLYNTLNSSGAYTLFAPVNTAFDKLPNDTLASLTSDASLLDSVLKYHVTRGFVIFPTIHDGTSLHTLNGLDVTFTKLHNGTLMIENAVVDTSSPDIILNNGVVYLIDSVLMPITTKVGEILLQRNDEFFLLNILLTITDMEPKLLAGDVTLFAPTNDAFHAISTILPDFSTPGADETYKQIMLNHMVNGTITSKSLQDGQVLTTLGGKLLHVTLSSGGIMLQADGTATIATVSEPDVKAVNGVIHVINQVLIPNGV